MDIDVLLTGVTGFVGRFILLDLILKCQNIKIGVVIRPRKGKTATQRFQEEIVNDTLFSRHSRILSKINVIGVSVEEIERTAIIIDKVQCIIHCAANVKHYDPYNMLLKDNVENIKVIMHLAETLHCKRLILLSTCYVHPMQTDNTNTTNGEIVRIPDTPRSRFYNDYCYTKWLGEEEVFKQCIKNIEVNIVRLSCVGSPLCKDLQSHPFTAQAHLGILSLVCRGYLKALGLTPNARLSIIPVDLVSKYIISIYEKPYILNQSEQPMPIIHQVCPPKNMDTFHPNLLNIFSVASELGIEGLHTVIHNGTSSNYLPSWYNVLAPFNKEIRRMIELHNKIQEFVLLFTSNDIRFASSLSDDCFPDITEKQFLIDTYNYCIRTAHQQQFKRGVRLSLTDKFWNKMGNNEPVQLCCKLVSPISIAHLEDTKGNIWALLNSNRKFTTIIENNKWIYKPSEFESYFGIVEFDENDHVTEGLILNNGLSKFKINNTWHCDIIIQSSEITHLLLQFDHGLTDGMGLIASIVNRVDNRLNDSYPVRTFEAPKQRKSLSWIEDIMYTIVFIFIIIVSFFKDRVYRGNRVSIPSICNKTIPLNSYRNTTYTFTTELLWKLTQSLANNTQNSNFIFCVPTAISVNRSQDKIIHNNFVPILLPVSSDLTKEQFKSRCQLLKSRGVIFLMYCIQELLTMSEWWWLRDKIMLSVTAVVSSVNLGDNMPKMFESVSVVTTTPNPILFGITAISDSKSSFITIRSHDSQIPALKIIDDICKQV